VKTIWKRIDYGIEPQGEDWATLLGNFLCLSVYNAENAFDNLRFDAAK
jgi:hypothetical protein